MFAIHGTEHAAHGVCIHIHDPVIAHGLEHAVGAVITHRHEVIAAHAADHVKDLIATDVLDIVGPHGVEHAGHGVTTQAPCIIAHGLEHIHHIAAFHGGEVSMVHLISGVKDLIAAHGLHLGGIHGVKHPCHGGAFQLPKLFLAHGINHIQCAGATKVRKALIVHVVGNTERALRSEGFESAIASGHFDR